MDKLIMVGILVGVALVIVAIVKMVRSEGTVWPGELEDYVPLDHDGCDCKGCDTFEGDVMEATPEQAEKVEGKITKALNEHFKTKTNLKRATKAEIIKFCKKYDIFYSKEETKKDLVDSLETLF